jgi:GDP-4-dehydro-6-deoxy-D-mannose reductase
VRVLITGIAGFVGTWLAEHVVEKHPEAEVWGLDRWDVSREELRGVEALVRFVAADLTDASSLLRALQAARPDVLFHLAASSTVSSSWATPAEILQANAVGQVHLLEAVRNLGLAPVTVLAGSAEAYGRVPKDENPVREERPLQPVSPYGVSKATQDLLAYQYYVSYALPTVRLRLFNHTGPRRPDRFSESSFARQIAEIERDLRPPLIQVGDLNVVRDITDVRDVARAYWLAATRGRPGEVYNVCSGRPVTIRQVLDHLLAMTDHAVKVQVDPGRLRPADIPVLYGDHARFTEATGWEPVIPLEQTLHDLLDWWRQRV